MSRQKDPPRRSHLTLAASRLIVDHGRAPEESIRRWQDRLTPAWKRIGGRCHFNRPIELLIKRGGFNTARDNELACGLDAAMPASNSTVGCILE
jgi:hypothetical protein